MLLKFIQCRGKPPHNTYLTQVSIVLKLRNPLEKVGKHWHIFKIFVLYMIIRRVCSQPEAFQPGAADPLGHKEPHKDQGRC